MNQAITDVGGEGWSR